MSPPINFATQRLNIDVIIFVILYFVYKKENINLAFRLSVVFLLSLLKFYPIVLLFAELFASFISKKIKNVFYVVLPIVGSMYYLFNFNSNQNVLDYYLRATESNRAFGILNDAIYISNFINKNLWVSLLLLTILICIFIFLFRNEHSKNVTDTHFAFITMFLGISSFINYDYRAIFLILIIDFLIQKNNKKLLATSIVFTYSSPTLLHGYEKYYYLVQNDQFFYFDYSFYLLTALLILYIWKYIYSNSKINFR